MFTMALFSFIFKALLSKNLGPLSSSDSASESNLQEGCEAATVSLFPLLDLRGGNFRATLRGAELFLGHLREHFSASSSESVPSFY